jgi:ribonuclease P protein component
MNTGSRKPDTANLRRAETCGFGSDNLLATRFHRVASPGNENHGNQTHFPALRGQAPAHARLSGPHEITRRPRRAECAPRQGTQAPRDLSEGRHTAGYAFSRAQRLQSEAEFAAVAQAGPDSIRLSQRWFVLMAKPAASTETATAPAARRVRFGLTVGKRLARRSVDRVLIKRILREAARHSVPRLAAVAATDLDIVLRLKAPLPPRETTPRGQLKRALRADADSVLRRLYDKLAAETSK